MNNEFLIGATDNNELIFCDVRLNDENVFSASFSTVSPLITSDKLIRASIENFVENLDSDTFLSFLFEFDLDNDCSPSVLVNALYNSSYNPIEDFFDTSFYPEIFNFGETEVFFESCGQQDTCSVVKDIFINKDFYDFISHLWDTSYLKPLNDSDILKLNSYLESSLINDEYGFIENWLLTILPELKSN